MKNTKNEYNQNETINEVLIENSIENSEKKQKKQKKDKHISYSQEILRKGIHLLSLSIPITYIFVDKGLAMTVLSLMAITAVLLDVLSKRIPFFNNLIYGNFGNMLRKHERKKKKFVLNGASWVLISAVITVFIFPKIIAITAFIILIVCDIAAALIGRKWGTHKLFNKSWEGTSAFIVSGFIVIGIVGSVFSAPFSFFVAGVLASIISGFVEAMSKKLKIDDNLSIPISFGIVMWVVEYNFSLFNQPFLDLIK